MTVDGDTPRTPEYTTQEYIILASILLDQTKGIISYAHNNTGVVYVFTQKEQPHAQIIITKKTFREVPWILATNNPYSILGVQLDNRNAIRKWLSTLKPELVLEFLL